MSTVHPIHTAKKKIAQGAWPLDKAARHARQVRNLGGYRKIAQPIAKGSSQIAAIPRFLVESAAKAVRRFFGD